MKGIREETQQDKTPTDWSREERKEAEQREMSLVSSGALDPHVGLGFWVWTLSSHQASETDFRGSKPLKTQLCP